MIVTNKNIFWLIVIIILLWFLLRSRVTGTGQFSFVGYDDEGRPVPLVEPATAVMMDIPRELPWSRWKVL